MPSEEKSINQEVLHILSLYSRRVCHDIIGPIGAILNGFELLDESEAGDDSAQEGEATALAIIRQSATTAVTRLKCYRSLFGSSLTTDIKDERQTAEGQEALTLFAEERQISVEWQVSFDSLAQPTGRSALISLFILLTILSTRQNIALHEGPGAYIKILVYGLDPNKNAALIQAMHQGLSKESTLGRILHLLSHEQGIHMSWADPLPQGLKNTHPVYCWDVFPASSSES